MIRFTDAFCGFVVSCIVESMPNQFWNCLKLILFQEWDGMGASYPAQTLASRGKVAPRVSLVFLFFFWHSHCTLEFLLVDIRTGDAERRLFIDGQRLWWVPRWVDPFTKEVWPWKVDWPSLTLIGLPFPGLPGWPCVSQPLRIEVRRKLRRTEVWPLKVREGAHFSVGCTVWSRYSMLQCLWEWSHLYFLPFQRQGFQMILDQNPQPNPSFAAYTFSLGVAKCHGCHCSCRFMMVWVKACPWWMGEPGNFCKHAGAICWKTANVPGLKHAKWSVKHQVGRFDYFDHFHIIPVIYFVWNGSYGEQPASMGHASILGGSPQFESGL